MTRINSMQGTNPDILWPAALSNAGLSFAS